MNAVRIFLTIFVIGLSLSASAGSSGRKPAQAPGLLPDEAVQTCLDALRKKALTNQVVDALAMTAPSAFTFHRIAPDALPLACPKGDLAVMKQALQNQIDSCNSQKSGALTDSKTIACRTYTRKEWCLGVSTKMLSIANAALTFADFETSSAQSFDWFQSDGKLSASDDGRLKKGDVQFTAYDSPPPIDASVTATADFTYPIYRAPQELIHLQNADARSCGNDPITGNKIRWCAKNKDGTLTLLPDRRSIDEQGALKNRGLEIAYVRDPIDVAFVMLEGSGSLNMIGANGKSGTVRLNFDALNGRPSQLLGRILKCEGAKPRDYSSEQGIRKFLKLHTDQLTHIMDFDQSYVFFRTSDKGPFGVDGTEILPIHSIATDRSVIPAGATSLIHTTNPTIDRACPMVTSLAISQDTGGAINGAHVDWYFGESPEAQVAAGNFNEPGALYLALPKDGGVPIEGCVVTPQASAKIATKNSARRPATAPKDDPRRER